MTELLCECNEPIKVNVITGTCKHSWLTLGTKQKTIHGGLENTESYEFSCSDPKCEIEVPGEVEKIALFLINPQSTSKQYKNGWESQSIDRELKDNPNPIGSLYYYEWQTGFKDAYKSVTDILVKSEINVAFERIRKNKSIGRSYRYSITDVHGNDIAQFAFQPSGELLIEIDNFPQQKQYYSTNLPIRTYTEFKSELARVGLDIKLRALDERY
jgi:hypothetical protein